MQYFGVRSLLDYSLLYIFNILILKSCLQSVGKDNILFEITLYKNKKNHTFTIHRLVAQAFLPNPENKEQVNHIDGNKLNNHLSNLEWTTKSENMLHAYQKNLSKVTVLNAIESRKKIILNLENGVFYNGLKEFAENNYLPKPYTIDNFKKTYNDKFVLV